MKRKEKGFSLILPVVYFSPELALCLESIHKNSVLSHELIAVIDPDPQGEIDNRVVEFLREKKVKVVINKKQRGPYYGWNKGSRYATRKILCFITDDQYFAPNWDYPLLQNLSPKRILTSQLVEPGVMVPAPGVIWKDFGENATNFKEKEFIRFLRKVKKRKLSEGRFFIPLVILKEEFRRLGGFPTYGHFGSVFTVPNDIIFIEEARKKGYHFLTCHESFSYHFQGATWRKKGRKLLKWRNKILYKYLKSFLGKFKIEK